MSVKLTTSFWSEKICEFHKLLYIRGEHAGNYSIVKEIDLTKDNFYISNWFKEISKIAISKEFKDSEQNTDVWYQFGLIIEDQITPIKWFDLILSDGTAIKHDTAFDTTLIHKNGVRIRLGRFPFNLKRYYKRRKYRIKRNAYKYIANLIKRS